MHRITRDEIPPSTVVFARALIGKIIRRVTSDGVTSGRIVETEAYEPGDASSHAYGGMTKRNTSMFLRRGHAYVYRIYGTSLCLNISSEDEDAGAAVLVRAVEPLEGIEIMRRRRPGIVDRDLARGPGRFTIAFAIDAALDGYDLCEGDELALFDDGVRPEVGASTRIGLTKEVDRLHRYYARASRYVSGPRALSP